MGSVSSLIDYETNTTTLLSRPGGHIQSLFRDSPRQESPLRLVGRRSVPLFVSPFLSSYVLSTPFLD